MLCIVASFYSHSVYSLFFKSMWICRIVVAGCWYRNGKEERRKVEWLLSSAYLRYKKSEKGIHNVGVRHSPLSQFFDHILCIKIYPFHNYNCTAVITYTSNGMIHKLFCTFVFLNLYSFLVITIADYKWFINYFFTFQIYHPFLSRHLFLTN